MLGLARALLQPIYLNTKIQESFDQLFPGKFKLDSLSFDFKGQLHVRNFQIVENNNTLINANNVHVDLKFWPLLFGDLHVTKIDIDNATFRWPNNDKGQPLWFDVFKRKDSSHSTPQKKSRLVLDAKVNVERLNAIYDIPKRKKGSTFIQKNTFSVVDGEIKDANIFLKDKNLTCTVPIHCPALNVELSFFNKMDEFSFEINSPEVYWNKNLSRSIGPQISKIIDFLRPMGAFKHQMRYVLNRKTQSSQWTMSSQPYTPSHATLLKPTLQPLGFNIPLTIEGGELNLDENGQALVQGNGIRFRYKNFNGNTFIKGCYYLAEGVSSIYIDEIDVSKPDIVQGLPPHILKIIKTLDPDGPVSVEIHYDHDSPEYSEIKILFKDLILRAISPKLSKLTGEVNLKADFKNNHFRGYAQLSSMECLDIQFGPEINLPVVITDEKIELGDKQNYPNKPGIDARGGWAYAKGYILINTQEKIMETKIDFSGIDLKQFQSYINIPTDRLELKGFVSGTLNLTKNTGIENKHDDDLGDLVVYLDTDDKRGINCKTSLPVSSFLDIVFDWTKIFKPEEDNNQYIKSGKVTFDLFPHKIEIKKMSSSLKGEPFNFGLEGDIRFNQTGHIKLIPAFTDTFGAITTIVTLGLLDKLVNKEIKWDADTIWIDGEIVWQAKK